MLIYLWGLFISAPLPAATLLVWPDSPNPTPPYADWTTAAQTIQTAVDAAQAGDTVLVTNGVYATGGRAVSGLTTNRVVIDKAVKLRSVNGPDVTVIQGYRMPGSTNGNGAIRCVYLTNGTVLSGFTLTNGATLVSDNGGGAWCASTNAVLTNCILTGNAADNKGGGAFSGTLHRCTLAGNTAAYGGGAYQGKLTACVLASNSAISGGGAYSAILTNCTLSLNTASQYGGGAYSSTQYNCTITGNSAPSGGGNYIGLLYNSALTGNTASQYGGGTYQGKLTNCTLTGNSASLSGGGAYNATLNNSILYYNTSKSGTNYLNGTLNYCCTTPLPGSGTSNIVSEPQLASPSRLSAGSPCRGAGGATYITGTDIDGEAWLNPPAIGCDEFQDAGTTGVLSATMSSPATNVSLGASMTLTASINGPATVSVWDFGDGTSLSNRPYASHTWNAQGYYLVALRAYNGDHPDGVIATARVQVTGPLHYVAPASTNPLPPYSSWEIAAQNIQDAV
ncbi:MAG: PKD domain-containing protein [Verrucomicrobiota bacterium]